MSLGMETGRLSIGNGSVAPGAPGGAATRETGGVSFADTLKAALAETGEALRESDVQATRLATGEAANLHEVVLATERANLALQFTMALRNKILEAYNELMRMPV